MTSKEDPVWNEAAAVGIRNNLVYTLTSDIGGDGLPSKLAKAVLTIKTNDLGSFVSWIGNANFYASPLISFPVRGMESPDQEWSKLMRNDERVSQLFYQTGELHQRARRRFKDNKDFDAGDYKDLLMTDLWLMYELACLCFGHLNKAFPGTVSGNEPVVGKLKKWLPTLCQYFNWQNEPNLKLLLLTTQKVLRVNKADICDGFVDKISPVRF